MTHVPATAADRASLWTFRLVVLVSVSVVLGVILVAGTGLFPDPADGPAPGRTRVAAYAVCAAFAVAMSLIPLVVGLLERRAGTRVVLGWRVVLAMGVLVAVAALGAGVWIWAYPPLHTECFTSVCESGRANRQLGDTRLHQGLLGGALVLGLTALAAARVRSRTEPAG
jgi:hypothetical protein